MSERMEGWYWCRRRELNPWCILRWSGSHWWLGDEALDRPPVEIDTECLHEPIADDDPGLLAARERAVAMATECGRGWLIERYINDKLHFWNAGSLGHGRRDGFTDLIDDAVRFARQEDAGTVLFHVCDGQGRVAEHVWFMGAGADVQ